MKIFTNKSTVNRFQNSLKLIFAFCILSILTNLEAISMVNYPNLIPNGTKFSCGNCHFNPNGGGSRTAFGNAFRANAFSWTKALAAMDSDNDGFSNGVELQDPNGEWTKSMPNAFGNPDLVTNPGNNASFPTSIVENGYELNITNAYPNPTFENTTFQITNMSNNNLEILTYDVNGNIIKTENINVNSDNFLFNWSKDSKNGANLPKGVYLIEFKSDLFNIRRKVILE